MTPPHVKCGGVIVSADRKWYVVVRACTLDGRCQFRKYSRAPDFTGTFRRVRGGWV